MFDPPVPGKLLYIVFIQIQMKNFLPYPNAAVKHSKLKKFVVYLESKKFPSTFLL